MLLDHTWYFVLLHGVVGGLDDSLMSMGAIGFGFAVACFAGYGLVSRKEKENAAEPDGD